MSINYTNTSNLFMFFLCLLNFSMSLLIEISWLFSCIHVRTCIVLFFPIMQEYHLKSNMNDRRGTYNSIRLCFYVSTNSFKSWQKGVGGAAHIMNISPPPSFMWSIGTDKMILSFRSSLASYFNAFQVSLTCALSLNYFFMVPDFEYFARLKCYWLNNIQWVKWSLSIR